MALGKYPEATELFLGTNTDGFLPGRPGVPACEIDYRRLAIEIYDLESSSLVLTFNYIGGVSTYISAL